MISEAEFNSNLSQFTGTENWYKSFVNPQVSYTDGVRYVAETCGAYWLLDEIASMQYDKKVHAEEFQVWKFKVDVEEATGVLVCEDGNGNKVYTKKFGYTSFPFPDLELWFTNNVILLKSEY